MPFRLTKGTKELTYSSIKRRNFEDGQLSSTVDALIMRLPGRDCQTRVESRLPTELNNTTGSSDEGEQAAKLTVVRHVNLFLRPFFHFVPPASHF
jgi:hypothetical protein